jgi:hypothetical protein
MPGLVPGIHILSREASKDVDGHSGLPEVAHY